MLLSRINCLIKHHARKAYWSSGGTEPGIPSSEVDEGKIQ